MVVEVVNDFSSTIIVIYGRNSPNQTQISPRQTRLFTFSFFTPTANTQSACSTNMVKGNPFKDDPAIVSLLKELDGIATRRQFRRWKKSFLQAFEDYLEEEGCMQVRASYRELCQILSQHVVLVKKMHAHIQIGDMSPEGCTVKSRQTLGNFFDQMIRVKQILIDLLPTTAKMEKEIGYTKFHLAAVLIDNGFVAYDRLSLCDDIHFHFKKWCLQDVASQLFLLEMDHYHTQLDIFCDILADLGLNDTMERCIKFLHMDDEETIEWNDEGSVSGSDDLSFSSSSEETDMDPLPDLSDITFDDEASLNLPLWKVHNFYVDNAEMAETFRNEMKRKSFEMFSSSNHSRDAKPPSKPTRSRDNSPVRPRAVSPPPPNAPTQPIRRLSIGNDDTNTDTANNASGKNSMDKTERKSNRTEMDIQQLSNRTVLTEELSNSDGSGEDIATNKIDETAAAFDKLSTRDLFNGNSFKNRRDGLHREDTGRFAIPTSMNYLAMPRSKLTAAESSSYEEEDSECDEEVLNTLGKKKTSKKEGFYSFANYYHGDPSDWRISTSTKKVTSNV